MKNRWQVAPGWTLSLLFALCFTLATQFQLWFQSWRGNRTRTGDLLTVLLGDSRRLFANHFFVRADVYFHGGYYPSLFDQAQTGQKMHIAETGASHTGEEAHDLPEFLKPPQDWIDRFGRHFYPTLHKHLDKPSEVAEMLPWLLASADLDPNNVQVYAVTAYWLRTHMGKVKEAEQFLRAGLRANPGNPNLFFELGRVYDESLHDTERARNTWEAALRQWQRQAANQPEPDKLLLANILTYLANLEERTQRYPQALRYLKLLKPVAPSPAAIQQQIDDLERRVAPPPK